MEVKVTCTCGTRYKFDVEPANGNKPGRKGFKEFSIVDANELTQHFWMKFWDEPDERADFVVLVNPAIKPR